MDYLDSLQLENRDKVIKLAITVGRKQRGSRRNKYVTIKEEILKRIHKNVKKKQRKQHLVRVLRTFWLGKLLDADYAV